MSADLRKLVADLDAKASDALEELLEGDEVTDDGASMSSADMELQDAIELLQAAITDWQQARGYI